MRKKTKVLFICKKRVDSYGISFGLLNSATFAAEALRHNGIEALVVSVNDANGIDAEVYRHRPTHVTIEALWVTPEKLDELLAIYAKIEWIIRIHSKVPFLATEGIAMEWISGYKDVERRRKNFAIAPNTFELHEDFKNDLGVRSVYLPNIYSFGKFEEHDHKPDEEIEYDNQPPFDDDKCLSHKSDIIDIGCFGAIRPLKNHLSQALAAIDFADRINKKLRFHINGNRLEQRGNEVLKNLRSLFGMIKHELVEHDWTPHAEFLKTVKTMDLGMQVSLSESFNIVTADFVRSGVPIVVSNDIEWMPSRYRANPNSTKDIADKLVQAWKTRASWLLGDAMDALKKHNREATKEWLRYLGK